MKQEYKSKYKTADLAGITFTVTMVHEKGRIEIQENTDVFLDVPFGIQGLMIASVHTDPKPFFDVVPDDECIIAPIVTLFYQPRSDEYSLDELKKYRDRYFSIQIPHIQKENQGSINVQSGHRIDSGKVVYKPIPRANDKDDTQEAFPKATFMTTTNDILIHMQQFCDFISTCKNGNCEKEAVALIYGGFPNNEEAIIRVYLGTSLTALIANRRVSIHIDILQSYSLQCPIIDTTHEAFMAELSYLCYRKMVPSHYNLLETFIGSIFPRKFPNEYLFSYEIYYFQRRYSRDQDKHGKTLIREFIINVWS